MNRRDFIIQYYQLLGAGLATHLLPFSFDKLQAQNLTQFNPDHFFLLLRVEGGMDVTLGLDPKTHVDGSTQEDIFLEYTEDNIIQSGNLKLGPAAASLAQFSNDVLIINGIHMRRDAGHEALNDYIHSGSGNGTSPILAVELAATTAQGPMGVIVNGNTLSGQRQVALTNTSTLLSTNNSYADATDLFASAGLEGDSTFNRTLDMYIKSKEPIQLFLKTLNDYKVANGDVTGFLQDILSVAIAFTSGLSRQSSMFIRDNQGLIDLDTHSNHEIRHLEQQKRVWDFVSESFKIFKSIPYKDGSLFDHTTFMVATEFSRTPYLNAAKGKDHNAFTNSVLLAGKGFNTNKSIGASHVIKKGESKFGEPLHIATPIDYKTGQVVATKESSHSDVGLIFPENVVRTVTSLFGDVKDFSSFNLSAIKPIPGAAKS